MKNYAKNDKKSTRIRQKNRKYKKKLYFLKKILDL